MFTYKNQMFQPVTAGPWVGVEQIKLPEAIPSNAWSGPKIPFELWDQILAFLDWSYTTTKSETIVSLFVNLVEGKWEALVLPQDGYNGMTVQLLPDHPNRIPTFQRLGRGWTPMGSVHHHCSADAFQSGTDSSDERSKEGLHITIGNVGSASYSIHARTSFRQSMFEANLGEWFPEDPALTTLLPRHLRAKAMEWKLTRPVVAGVFPDWWKENVIKVERPKYVHQVTSFPTYRQVQGAWVKVEDPAAPPPPLPALTNGNGNGGAKRNRKTQGMSSAQAQSFRAKCFLEAIETYFAGNEPDQADLKGVIADLEALREESGWLIEPLIDNQLDIGSAIDEVQAEIDEMNMVLGGIHEEPEVEVGLQPGDSGLTADDIADIEEARRRMQEHFAGERE